MFSPLLIVSSSQWKQAPGLNFRNRKKIVFVPLHCQPFPCLTGWPSLFKSQRHGKLRLQEAAPSPSEQQKRWAQAAVGGRQAPAEKPDLCASPPCLARVVPLAWPCILEQRGQRGSEEPNPRSCPRSLFKLLPRWHRPLLSNPGQW